MVKSPSVITFSDTQHSYFVFFNDTICGYTVTRNRAAARIGCAATMRNGISINERGVKHVVQSGKESPPV